MPYPLPRRDNDKCITGQLYLIESQYSSKFPLVRPRAINLCMNGEKNSRSVFLRGVKQIRPLGTNWVSTGRKTSRVLR